MSAAPPLRIAVAVGLGGAIGAVARWGLAELWDPSSASIPWATLAANVIGALALGIVVRRASTIEPSWITPGLAIGLIGTLTTTSSFAFEVGALARADHVATAFSYLALTLALGLAGAFAGLRIGAAE